MKTGMVSRSVVLVLAVTLAMVSFTSVGCRKEPKEAEPTAKPVVPPKVKSSLEILPQDADTLLQLNIASLMKTPAAAKALEDMTAEQKQQLDDFIATYGLDPRKDVTTVHVAIKTTGETPSGAAIVEGTFDKKTLTAQLKELAPEMESEEYGGLELMSVPSPDNPTQVIFGAFLNDGRIVVGSEDYVKSVIDLNDKGGMSIKDNAELSKAYAKLDTNAAFRGAGPIPLALSENPMVGGMAEGLKSWMSSLNVGDGVQISISAITETEEQATELKDTLTGLLPLAQMQAASADENAAKVLELIQITAEGSMATISVNVPQDLVDKLAASAQASATG